MAPEILRYEKYDAKADLWSVGAVLYEMCVGRAPYRAQNHIDLLKKIEQSRGVKFPDEEPPRGSNAEEIKPVPDDIKALIRMLLKRLPAERASFDDFFKSTALAKSKFPRPSRQTSMTTELPDAGDPIVWTHSAPPIPEHHRVIPPEVLDPQAMIPPSRINFRNGRRESDVSSPKEEVAASPIS
jgi:serine/threonine-protein kinase ULK2